MQYFIHVPYLHTEFPLLPRKINYLLDLTCQLTKDIF